MNPFSREDLNNLLAACVDAQTCVSIYMPTIPLGEQTQQNPIRLKNLLNDAEEKLRQAGLRTPDIAPLLEPARGLLADPDFWKHQSHGLAVFLTEDSYEAYRVPIQFEELVVIGERFHLKPMLPLLTEDGRFYILAFSQNDVRLLEGTRYTVSEVELQNVPTSMDEALKWDDPENQVNYHASNRGSSGSSPIFHGYNPSEQEYRDNLRRYLNLVNDGLVSEVLHGRNAPLVLAGVDFTLPLYESVNTYPYLAEQGITGSPDRVSDKELHQKAWEIVEPVFRFNRERASEQYKAASSVTSCDLKEVLTAAAGGRINTLFIRRGQQVWGNFDVTSQELTTYDDFKPGAVDLYDEAALQTLNTSGFVYVLDANEMPDPNEPIAALFRY